MHRLAKLVLVALAATGVVALCAGLWLLRGGNGAKAKPSAFEATVARGREDPAVPRRGRSSGDAGGGKATSHSQARRTLA